MSASDVFLSVWGLLFVLMGGRALLMQWRGVELFEGRRLWIFWGGDEAWPKWVRAFPCLFLSTVLLLLSALLLALSDPGSSLRVVAIGSVALWLLCAAMAVTTYLLARPRFMIAPHLRP